MTVHLHIDRVILSDVELGPAQLQALEEELHEQIQASLAQQWEGVQIRRIEAAAVRLGQGSDGQAIGAAIGDALRTSLSRA